MLKDLGDERAYDRVENTTLERLMRYDWPGNVRELRNAVAVAYALCDADGEIDAAAHLGALTEGSPAQGGRMVEGSPDFERPFQEAKREVLSSLAKEYFSHLAEQASGNVSEMARRAGMERAHVRTYLKRHGIDVKQYR
jgi:DNA-binding NtrC family response regulator